MCFYTNLYKAVICSVSFTISDVMFQIVTLKTHRKYQPVLEIIEVDECNPSLELNRHEFAFPETAFFTVTAYYSEQVSNIIMMNIEVFISE